MEAESDVSPCTKENPFRRRMGDQASYRKEHVFGIFSCEA